MMSIRCLGSYTHISKLGMQRKSHWQPSMVHSKMHSMPFHNIVVILNEKILAALLSSNYSQRNTDFDACSCATVPAPLVSVFVALSLVLTARTSKVSIKASSLLPLVSTRLAHCFLWLMRLLTRRTTTTGSGLSDNCTRLSKLMLSRTLSQGFSPFSLIVRRDSSRVLRQCFHIVPMGIASVTLGTTCIRNSRTKISANTFGKPHVHSPSTTLIMHSKKWRILTSVQFIGFSRLYQQSIGQSCTS